MDFDDLAYLGGIIKDSINDAIEDNLLHYYIAHAPAVPNWFEPIMPEKPKEPRWNFNLYSIKSSTYKTFEAWTDEEFRLSETKSGLSKNEIDYISQYCQEWKEWNLNLESWQQEYQKEKLLQWPIFYAKEILARIIV